MNTILVPTDFSPAARSAADYAIELAREMQYNILLFTVYGVPIVLSSDTMGTIVIDTLQIEADVKKNLLEEADFLRKKSGLDIQHEAINGEVSEEIIAAVKRHQPALLIMGMKPAGALSERIFGSTTTDLLLKIPIPLIIVPENTVFRKPQRVVFAHDPKMETEIKIDQTIKNIFEKFYSTIYILTVVKENEPEGINKKAMEQKTGKLFEDRFHSYYSIENNNVTEGINEFTSLHDVDLVTMIPYKHNLLKRLFTEGQTKRLAFHTRLPILSLNHNPL